uniref:Uncharacterized protein n=1 Tax=Trichogramma kaykai TaxID=54128 RepID=A0ABD2X5C1_9HYME
MNDARSLKGERRHSCIPRIYVLSATPFSHSKTINHSRGERLRRGASLQSSESAPAYIQPRFKKFSSVCGIRRAREQ